MIDPCDKGQSKLKRVNRVELPSTSLKNPNPETSSKRLKKRSNKKSDKKPTGSDSDEELNKAYDQCVKEDSLLPILKQELRLKIQTRRLSEGQGELLPERAEPKVYEVSISKRYFLTKIKC